MNQSFDAAAVLAACRSLSVFRGVRAKPLFAAFEKLLAALAGGSAEKLCARCARFVFLLADKNENLDWRSCCAAELLLDDNPCTRACENGSLAPQLECLARADLVFFERIASVPAAVFLPAQCVREFEPAEKNDNPAKVKSAAQADNSVRQGCAASFEQMCSLLRENSDWADLFDKLASFWRQGAGVLAGASAFVWKTGALVPVKKCDHVPYERLYGYEIQRQVVYENTLRFAAGHRANNLLLYGDRGTGKSATVKSVAAFFAQSADESKNRLRIVEVRKEQLDEFARIAEELAKRDFRFMVFIDDLSFNETDERYIGLKALLEGGLESRPPNVILYATSNRRHLVKEKAADRTGLGSLDADAEIRAEDAVQEHLSLADRFGMTVIFSSPDQDEYLNLVFSMLKERGLRFDEEIVRVNALRWEKWYNGRSPRTARQFADWFCAGTGFPWDEKSR